MGSLIFYGMLMFKRIICAIFLFLLIAQLFATTPQKVNSNSAPSVIVIFGATGDLTIRKVMPAIYDLAQDGNLSENTVVVGVGRREYTDLTFREQMRLGIDKFSRTKA